MIRIDTIHISITAKLVEFIGLEGDIENRFDEVTLNLKSGIKKSYVSNSYLPFGVERIVLVSRNGEDIEYEIKLSSKILLGDYDSGINKNNLVELSRKILFKSGFYIKLEGWLQGDVHRCDIVRDCLYPDPEPTMNLMLSIQIANTKFVMSTLKGESLRFKPLSKVRKEKLSLYLKSPELKRKCNKPLHTKKLIEWAKKCIRVEMQIYSCRRFRFWFGSNILKDILFSDMNPVISVFDEVYMGIDASNFIGVSKTKKDFVNSVFAQYYHCDIQKIRNALRKVISKGNLARDTKCFEDIISKIQGAKLFNEGGWPLFKKLRSKVLMGL